MDLRKIGKFIAKKRQEKGFTQESLAEELDISNRSVSKWERGICLPDAENMAKLCKALNVTYNELLSGNDIRAQDAVRTTEQTVARVVNYADQQTNRLRRALAGVFIATGVVTIIAATSIFESGTHASAFGSMFGVVMVLTGFAFIFRKLPYFKRLLAYFGVFAVSMAILFSLDFLSVHLRHIPPRFTYNIVTWNDTIYYDTPFYDVVRCFPDTDDETWQIIGNSDYDAENVAEWSYCPNQK